MTDKIHVKGKKRTRGKLRDEKSQTDRERRLIRDARLLRGEQQDRKHAASWSRRISANLSEACSGEKTAKVSRAAYRRAVIAASRNKPREMFMSGASVVRTLSVPVKRETSAARARASRVFFSVETHPASRRQGSQCQRSRRGAAQTRESPHGEDSERRRGAFPG